MITPNFPRLACAFLFIASLSLLAGQSSSRKAPARFKFLVPPNMFYAVPFGSNFKLNCTTNDPQATTELYHRQTVNSSIWNLVSPRPGKVVKSGHVYTTLSFGISDAGQYQCRATNAAGITITWSDFMANVIPNPNMTPPLNIYPEYAVVLTTGQSYNVTCSSASTVTLQWFKKLSDGTEIAVSSDQTYSESASAFNTLKLVLMFKNAQKGDAGTYMCKLTYQTKTNYKYSTLQVYEHELPRILSSSSTPLLTKHSKETTLHCLVYGHPRPDVDWYKDGKQIKIQDCRISMLNRVCKDSKYEVAYKPITKHTKINSSLTIFDTKFPSDQGRYTCIAVNSQGKGNKTLYVDVKAPVLRFKFLVRPLMFYTVPFGSNFKLNCTTTDPKATTELYHHQTVSSSIWNLISPRPGKVLKSGHVYTILSFGISDAGQYQCRATNASGTTITWSDRMANVIPNPNLTPPLNIYPEYAVVLTTGQLYNVTCSSVLSSTLQWFKQLSDGTEIAVPSDQTYSESDSGLNKLRLVLMFKNAQKGDAGTYRCLMTYQGKSNQKFTSLKVVDKGSVPHLKGRTKVLSVNETSRAVMACTATGDPLPYITWYKGSTLINCLSDGKPCGPLLQYSLKQRTKTKNNTKLARSWLKISSASRVRDQGTYSCAATNKYGVVKRSYQLTVT